jgi:hypothetical protein
VWLEPSGEIFPRRMPVPGPGLCLDLLGVDACSQPGHGDRTSTLFRLGSVLTPKTEKESERTADLIHCFTQYEPRLLTIN